MAYPLDMDQLRTFVAIVDAGSFTRAADAVHKTQSAVSMQVKRLEERVGRTLFAREGRGARLTDDGDRLLHYARRIVQLQAECVASFGDGQLTGPVRLGLPDDYADRYLPEILVRFSRSTPGAEVTVVCEPTPMLLQRLDAGDLDLAIVTQCRGDIASEVVRAEQLLWVTSARHAVHRDEPVPLALGRADCAWRRSALEALEETGRPYRILFVSWNSTAVGAAVLAGLTISVLPESALRPGMRVLGPADGFPALPSCKIGLVRGRGDAAPLTNALAAEIRQSLDNLGTSRLASAAE